MEGFGGDLGWVAREQIAWTDCARRYDQWGDRVNLGMLTL